MTNILLILFLSSITLAWSDDVCVGVSCGHGRECVATNGTPACQCARSCPEHRHPVCGSDSAYYPNHCELHRHACMLGRSISVDKSEKSCKETPEKAVTKRFREKPIVCYQEERDHLRDLLIEWSESRRSGDESPRSRDDSVREAFLHCDANGDAVVNSMEFLGCSEEDPAILSTPTPDLPEDQLTEEDHQKVTILRGLCIDALIDAEDKNGDWGLDLDEFSAILDPSHLLPKKRCVLEDRQFEDGLETKVSCNSCICACGNWVCTSKICDNDVLPPPTPVPVNEAKRDSHPRRHVKHHLKHRNLNV